MAEAVKLSSPATGEFWEIPVLFEDNDLLALNKPAGLLVSPDRADPARPALIPLLHRGIERGAPWAVQRNLSYAMNAHRLDFEAGGVLLLARSRVILCALAAQFGAEPPRRCYTILAAGEPKADQFETDAKLAPNPLQMGLLRVDPKCGKRSRTEFAVRERFKGCQLLECRPVPDRPHQVRAHARHLRLPLVGDEHYGGRPLLLSHLKADYRLKPGQEERPLMGRPALHLERVVIDHPATGEKLTIEAPWPKDLSASVKYLRRYAI